MSGVSISPSAYDSAVAGLKAGGRLPSLAEFSPASGRLSAREKMDMTVDLKAAVEEAIVKKVDALSIFADVVRIPRDFKGGLRDPLHVLRVVARRLEVEGGEPVVLDLKDEPKRTAATQAQFLVGEMTGDFQIRSRSPKNPKPAESLHISPGLDFVAYVLEKSEGDVNLVRFTPRLPLNLLDKNRPLHHLLKSSFELAAGLIEDPLPEPPKLELARSILKWLIRWSTYPNTDLISLFQAADALERVLPAPVPGGNPPLVHRVPSETRVRYLEMASKQLASARDSDIKARLEGIGGQISQVAQQVVGVWRQRDGIDLAELDTRIDDARVRLKKAVEAVARAGKEMEDQKFDNEFSERNLQLQLKLDTIDKLVSAAFELTTAVAQIGIGIAIFAATGTPASLAAANPADLVKKAAAWKDAGTLEKTFGVLKAMYGGWIPHMVKSVAALDKDARDAMVNSFKIAFEGMQKFYQGAKALSQSGILNPEQIGALVNTAASSMDPVEAKASWDAFLVDATTRFVGIEKGKYAVEVHKAAAEYRAGLEKLVIYGRLLADQQANMAQCVREVGTLTLRKDSVTKKRGELASLEQNLGDQAAAKKALEAENNDRLQAMGRAFFTTLWGFRSSFFYEGMTLPATRATIPANSTQMDALYLAMDREKVTPAKEWVLRGDLKETLVFTGESVLKNLRDFGSAKIAIHLDNPRLKSYDLVRIAKMEIRLEGVTPNAADGISLTLASERSFLDHSLDQSVSYDGEPVELKFTYGAKWDPKYEENFTEVQPTPFSTWTLRIDNRDAQALDGLSAVHLTIVGKARKR